MAPTGGPYAALFSVFGLQQLPDPEAAIAAWVNVLAPGGVAVVVYWPVGACAEINHLHKPVRRIREDLSTGRVS